MTGMTLLHDREQLVHVVEQALLQIEAHLDELAREARPATGRRRELRHARAHLGVLHRRRTEAAVVEPCGVAAIARGAHARLGPRLRGTELDATRRTDLGARHREDLR